MSETLSLYGRMVLPDRVLRGTLTIADGRIASIGAVKPGSGAALDFGECYIMPGLIEVHGHLREPGQAHKEDRLSGTRAAVAGGVTTILDMPNTAPPTTTRQLLEDKIASAEGRSFCDYGFIFGGATDNAAELEALDPDLVAGVKFFMAGHETTPTTVADLSALYELFEILARRGMMALVHAEHQQLINRLSARYLADDSADGVAYSRSRGEVTAATAALEAISLARAAGTRLYLCHLSTPAEMAALAWAKEQRLPVYGEAVTYHLTLNTTHYASLGTRVNVSPALRSPEQQDGLWAALAGGLIDTVCSEHTPHTLEEKQRPMRAAASGMPGIQESLPLLWTALRQRLPERSDDEHALVLSRLMATNVARIFGLAGKGELRVGNDADLVVVNPEKEWEIRKEDLFTKCGWSAYEGWRVQGRPTATFVRGERMYDNGEVVGEPLGKQIRYGDRRPR